LAFVIVVAGVVNVEVSVPVDGFPVSYVPVRYPRGSIGVRVGGVGYCVAAGLAALGWPMRLATFVGDDPIGDSVRAALAQRGLLGDAVVQGSATARAVVLHDNVGNRMVSTDLRELPDAAYPEEKFAESLDAARLAVITNIGFARPLLAVARAAGVPVAADVQAVSRIDDPYNADWMDAADILFCSHEKLPVEAGDWARMVQHRYGCSILVIGLGASGALLAVRGRPPRRVPAVSPRGVVNTVGAGDALAAGFLATYLETGDADTAIERAVTFAGYKVGAANDEEGYCSAEALRRMAEEAFSGSGSKSRR
jgi:acarbose 7IV-phosphotransferase